MLMSGCGNLKVLPSWVAMYGILLFPMYFLTTLQSLKLASLASILCGWNLPLTSSKILKNSLVFSILTTSIWPRGNLWFLLIFPSTLMRPSFCLQIFKHSYLVKAYFSLYCKRTLIGMHSLSLWGPAVGLVEYTPLSFPRYQFFGAATLFITFL